MMQEKTDWSRTLKTENFPVLIGQKESNSNRKYFWKFSIGQALIRHQLNQAESFCFKT